MNETMKAIKARKSVRKFEEKEIPLEIKNEILDASLQAPTAGNQILYSIIDVTDPVKKEILVQICDKQHFIKEAPLVLIYLADCQKYLDIYQAAGISPRNPGEGDLLLAYQDAMIAAQNSVVAAESFGIGSCYIGDVIEQYEEMKSAFNLPSFVMPAGMLVFGYPTKQQAERNKPGRFAREHIVFENEYRKWDKEEIIHMYNKRHEGEEHFEFNRFVEAFHKRKYNTKFSLEMTRSSRHYLEAFSHLDIYNQEVWEDFK